MTAAGRAALVLAAAVLGSSAMAIAAPAQAPKPKLELLTESQRAALREKQVELAKKLEEVCPVDIFAASGEDGGVRVVRENLDECVLCELCIQAAPPGAVRVRKLYDGTELVRDS